MNAAIFVVTCARHLPFFKLCARSIEKHARGFSEAVVVVPTADVEAFRALRLPMEVRHRWEATDRTIGHRWMNATKCYADVYCPSADLIAHIDGDSVFTRETTPSDYLIDDTIPVLVKEYADAGDALVWRPMVEQALNVSAKWETMQRPELAYWRETYGDMREHIKSIHRQPFLEYALTHHVPEFPSLGTFALQIASRGKYFPTVNATRFIRQGWSHHVDNPPTLQQYLEELERAIG